MAGDEQEGIPTTKVIHQHSPPVPTMGIKLTTLSSGKVNFEVTIKGTQGASQLDRMLSQAIAVAEQQAAIVEANAVKAKG